MPIDEVEPASRIARRFVSSAMSLGALSPEAHQAISIGMARLGGSANSGEGGEDPAWYAESADGDRRDAAIKQVASARFGVTAEYLARAEQLEIKIAQGSKPGEGGQLPGKKATAFIAGAASRAAGHDDDQPAAASRHLLDRGSRPAHQRPACREPHRAHRREAGCGSRDRHDCGGRGEGARRLRDGQRSRRRDGRVSAELDQARRAALGARPGRDAPGARPQPAPRPGRAAHRWRPADRPRRGRCRDARRGGVRVRDRRAGRDRLRHGAPVPPRHLPHRDRDPARGPARQVHRHAGAGGCLLHCPGGGRPPRAGAARPAVARRGDRAGGPPRRKRPGGRRSRSPRVRSGVGAVIGGSAEGSAAVGGPASGRQLRGRCARRDRQPRRPRARRWCARRSPRAIAASARGWPVHSSAARSRGGCRTCGTSWPDRPGRASARSRWPACASSSSARPTTTSARDYPEPPSWCDRRTGWPRTRRWRATCASSAPRPARFT